MSELDEVDLFKECCENDFAFFVKQYLKVIEPETVFEWNWHMTTLCHYCEKVYYGQYQNLDINISPRMLKSIIVSVMFPCWVWTKQRSKKFICASHSYDLSVSFNMKRRELIESREYMSLWPIALKEDNNTSHIFENYDNGFMKAVSALGKVTGAGADFLISDDLIDAKDSFSKTKREAVTHWFSNAFYNRAQDKKKVRRININQRLHQKDISGHIEEFHNYHKLVIPMVMTENNESTVDFIDPRSPGEFMHPSRYSEKEKLDDYKALGVYGWSSQYQQSPRPIGGGIIKEEWIRYYDIKERQGFDKKIITGDLSFKGNKKSDYVCFQAWGRSGADRYLIDIIRGKWSYKTTKENFLTFCEKHTGADKYIEDKANGPAILDDLKSDMPGLYAWPRPGSSYMNADKIQRLHLVSKDYELGNVWIPKDMELVELFVEELLGFTENGSTTGNDDMVDTSTMALLELKKSATFALG